MVYFVEQDYCGDLYKKVKGTSSLRLIAAPAIYGQINFDEDDPRKEKLMSGL